MDVLSRTFRVPVFRTVNEVIKGRVAEQKILLSGADPAGSGAGLGTSHENLRDLHGLKHLR